MDALFNVSLTLGLLLGTYLIGSAIERRHFRHLLVRERANADVVVSTFARMPEGWRCVEATLVTGSVVVSLDYFKRFLAGLRALVGGRVKAYEPLLSRGRREAMLRMIEEARTGGFEQVINVRLETSRLASSGRDGAGTAGVEILAFGTAVKVEREG